MSKGTRDVGKRTTARGVTTEESAFAEVVQVTVRAINELDEKERDRAVAALRKGAAEEQSPDSIRLIEAVLAELMPTS